MSWEPPKDQIDSASMRGEIFTRVAFHEIIVEGAEGEEKWFDAKQSGDVGRFVNACALPVRITLSYYPPGSGMEFVYRSNKRRSNLKPGGVVSKVLFFEGAPDGRKEKAELGAKLIAQGLKPTIVAEILGINRTNAYHLGKTKKAVREVLRTATAHGCA